MSTLRLYEIAHDYLHALETLAEDDDLPEEVIADTLAGLAGTFEVKAQNLARYIRNLEAEVTAIDAARTSMERRQRSLQRHAERLRAYLKAQMEASRITRITSPERVVRVQKNPPTVMVDEADEIPLAYKATRIETVLLKADIGQALKAGVVVPGARLAQTTRLVIG
jgi:hypothetical protein